MWSLGRNYISVGLNLMSNKPTHWFVSQRGIRGVRRIYRTELPRYKKLLRNLPPLTSLLTETSVNSNLEIKDAIQIRLQKLEVYKEYLPVNSNSNLLEALFHKDNDIDRLLRIIDQNLETMTSFYVGVSFEAIDDMMRAGLCEPSTVAVSPEFKKLCNRALYKVRFFEADEVLKLLKCFSTLHAPEDILLVQAALQMARHLINDFDLDELTCLAQTLDSIQRTENFTKETSLLCALKLAIPLVERRQLFDNQYTKSKNLELVQGIKKSDPQ